MRSVMSGIRNINYCIGTVEWKNDRKKALKIIDALKGEGIRTRGKLLSWKIRLSTFK